MRALLLSLVALAALAWLALRTEPRGARDVAAAGVEANVAESSPAPAALVAAEAAPAAAETAPPEVAPAAREELAQRALPVSGRVVVPGGMPPDERAVVVAHLHRADVPRKRSRLVEAPVAPDGSFALEAPEGTEAVQLALRGRMLVLRETTEVAPGSEGVVLRPDVLALVRGRVRRAAPAPPGADEPPILATCTGLVPTGANAAGELRLVVQPGLRLELVAWTEPTEAPRRTRTEARLALEPLAPGEVREVELALEPFAAPRGLVLDARGAPIEGASVSARRDDGAGPDDAALTGADGRFELEALPPGEWLVVARAEGHFGATETIALPEDGERELVLRLDERALVRGRVLAPDGAPAARALVFDSRVQPMLGRRSAGGSRMSLAFVLDAGAPGGLAFTYSDDAPGPGLVRADADGRFELEADLPRLRLSAFGPGVALAARVEVELRPGALVEDVVLRLRPACTLRGTALDEDGRKVTGQLWYRSADGLELCIDVDDGAFEASPLPPGAGTLFRAETDGGPHGSSDVVLEPSHETTVELRLRRGWTR